ncbi:type II secretion system protein [Paenibacillus xanthanilyticus]|uniref:Type II secretion system protein n=1 Tax=Paenibacillus xanthanilyticus TaxID=1783531 RepID=A0ABV8KBC1_9BACL
MFAKAMKQLKKEEKGFTLIELLAVIVILGIIAAIAVPLIGNIIANSREDSDVATARQLYDAARLYVVGEENGDFQGAQNVTLDEMQDEGYMDLGVTLPSTRVALDPANTFVTFDGDGQLTSVTLNTNAGTGTTANHVFNATQVMAAEDTTN